MDRDQPIVSRESRLLMNFFRLNLLSACAGVSLSTPFELACRADRIWNADRKFSEEPFVQG